MPHGKKVNSAAYNREYKKKIKLCPPGVGITGKPLRGSKCYLKECKGRSVKRVAGMNLCPEHLAIHRKQMEAIATIEKRHTYYGVHKAPEDKCVPPILEKRVPVHRIGK